MDTSPPANIIDLVNRLKNARTQSNLSGIKKYKYAIGLLIGLVIAFQLFFVYIKPNEFGNLVENRHGPRGS